MYLIGLIIFGIAMGYINGSAYGFLVIGAGLMIGELIECLDKISRRE